MDMRWKKKKVQAEETESDSTRRQRVLPRCIMSGHILLLLTADMQKNSITYTHA